MTSILQTIPTSQQIQSQVDNYINTLPCFIEKLEYVEFWVGNAFQSSHFYAEKFQMKLVAFQGLETGERHFRSYILQQNDVIIKVTSHLQPQACSKFQDYFSKHGDSVYDVAFRVSNTKEAFDYAVSHGALVVTSPTKIYCNNNKESYIEVASIKAPFATWQHTFIDRTHFKEDESNTFLPNFKQIPLSQPIDTYLEFIDHIAFAIHEGTLSTVIQWYHEALGFIRFLSNDDDDGENGLQINADNPQIGGLKTMVICPFSSFIKQKSIHNVKFVMVEPKSSKSQIQEFLDFNNGTGAAHLAFHTSNIIEAVKLARSKNVPFVTVPFTYYENWSNEKREIFDKIHEDWESLSKYEILVDSNATWHYHKEGQEQKIEYLLQTFTQPLTDRPTFYFEYICRKGADGFGKGNITSLFEAIARLQKQRGNL